MHKTVNARDTVLTSALILLSFPQPTWKLPWSLDRPWLVPIVRVHYIYCRRWARIVRECFPLSLSPSLPYPDMQDN